MQRIYRFLYLTGMKKYIPAIAALLCYFFSFSQTGFDYYLLIGTYTTGKSEGIYVYKFNSSSGEFSPVSKIWSGNPSFLAVSPDTRFVYSVNENQPGGVSSFSFDKSTGNLKELNKQPSGGDHPCYITTDKTGKWVITGNYSGGNLSVLPVNKDGSLEKPIQTINHEGSSVNTARQEKPHVHATVFSPDGKYLFVPDLGIDKVMIYKFNSKKGKLIAHSTPFAATAPGSGPRHFDFHPSGKYAYLMEELTGSVSVFSHKKGRLNSIQTISALPADFRGSIGSADIHVSPDGKYLYSSNRGESNSIALFSIAEKSGKLTAMGHRSTEGKTPRNFNFDPSGNFLLVANQNSDEIVIFRRNSGLLEDTGKRIQVPKPVCIKWISAQ